MSLMRAAEDQRLKSDVVRMALELEFPAEEAARQLETAVSWGRYADLLAYDYDEEMLYLEPAD
jgi:NitT/TauT family transport system ATP-binding protein